MDQQNILKNEAVMAIFEEAAARLKAIGVSCIISPMSLQQGMFVGLHGGATVEVSTAASVAADRGGEYAHSVGNSIHSLTDAFALASVALGKDPTDSPLKATVERALFDVYVTDESGVRTLVREKVSGELSDALVSAANHGAKVEGIARIYEAVQVDVIN